MERSRSIAAGAVTAFVVGAFALPAHSATAAPVTIQAFQFTPALVTIEVGDTVSWTNNDFVAHNVSGGMFSSGNFASGTFSHTFTEAGSFPYICTLHSGMEATVAVVETPPPPVVSESGSPALLGATAAVVLGGCVMARRRIRRRRSQDDAGVTTG
jgi:plastocyanin